MKKGVLVCIGNGERKNIGDYVQSIAARQFAGLKAVSIERESLHKYCGDKTKLVMNAWFMHHPKRFPPSCDIIPLFVSFHVRPTIEDSFFTERTIEYLRSYEPIGCRSTDAVDMLNRHGIKAEFTSCVTLTLGNTYRHKDADTPVVFVDPFFVRPGKRWWRPMSLFKMALRIPYIFLHWRIISRLAGKFRVYGYWFGNRFFFVRWYNASEFYRAYSPAFSDEVLLSAEYITHKVLKSDYPTEEALFECADRLLRRYEKAPFVVTSRLHCALPCIAMGTPVWVPYHNDMTTGRFGGNDAFMNKLKFTSDGRLIAPSEGKIRPGDIPPVRDEHKPYAETLARRCREFMEGA